MLRRMVVEPSAYVYGEGALSEIREASQRDRKGSGLHGGPHGYAGDG